jgi:tetratricopeptide (TPR) repeat protein
MNCYQEALSLRIAVLGDDNIEVAYSLHCIAKINRMQHDIDAARENFNTALRIKRLKLPKNHPSIAETLEQLGSLYVEIGEDDEAALCLNGALNIYKAKHGEGIKVAEVYEQLGDKYEREQSFGKALMYYHKALRVRVKVFGEDHVSVADAYYHVGRLQRDQQSDHEALSSFQAATKIRKKTVGRNDVIISDILKDAGQLQMKLGQVEIANKCFGESLRIRSAILDPRHMKIGECHVLHSDVLIAQGKYVEAIANLQEALEIFQDSEGDCGDSCLQVYQRLAQACKESSEFDKAQEYYEKCLKCRRQRQEESNSIAIAKINHGLGQVFYAMGDYRRAEEFFRDCVEAMVAELGEDHLEVANAVLSLGMTCTKLNSPDEANMYFEQARLTKQQHLGDGNLEVAEIGLEIGRANVVKKEYEEALQCFQSYLRIRRVAVGDDVLVCNVLHEIGCAEHSLGRHDAALKSLASALALYRVLLGDEDVAVADTLYTLGVVYEAKHEFRESIKYHKEAFRLRRQLLGADDLAVADSLDKISSLYLRQPNLEKALQSMKEVLRIRTLHLGKDHIDVGTSLFGMGVIFAEVGDMDKAMDCYKVSLKIRKENLGDASVEVAQTFHNMGTVLGRQQDYPSALKHWRKALNSYREAGLSDENHLVAITIGNINMAEAYLHDVNEDNKQA